MSIQTHPLHSIFFDESYSLDSRYTPEEDTDIAVPQLGSPRSFLQKNATQEERDLVKAVSQGKSEEVERLLAKDSTLSKSRITVLIIPGLVERLQNATLLHVACFLNSEVNIKIAKLLIQHAKIAGFDIVSAQADRISGSGSHPCTALDLIIYKIANVNLASCLFQENVLLSEVELKNGPPIHKMIQTANFRLIEKAFKWASSKYNEPIKNLILKSTPLIGVIADLVVDYIPSINCREVIELANQTYQDGCGHKQTPLSDALHNSRKKTAELLLEMGADWNVQLQETTVLDEAKRYKNQWFLDLVAKRIHQITMDKRTELSSSSLIRSCCITESLTKVLFCRWK